MPGGDRSAAQPRLHRVGQGPGKADPVQRPGHQITDRADGELTDLAGPPEAARAATGGDLKGIPGGHRRRPAAQPSEQHRSAGLQPQRRRVRRGRAVAAEPDRHTGRPQLRDRRQPTTEDHVAARAVRDPGSPPAQPGDFGRVRADAVGDPGPVTAPADVVEVLDRTPAVGRQAVVVLLRVLGEMGVQPHVETFGELGGGPHQLGADREG